MPELPEVETIRRALAPRLCGRTLASVRILDPRWCAPDAAEVVCDALRGRRVCALQRRGKYLILVLDTDAHLVMHLRMTGTLLYDPPGGPRPAHARVLVEVSDGHRLAFCDPRRFGTGRLMGDRAALRRHLDVRLGLEPLDPAFTVAHLRAVARGRRAPVKAFVLDQRRMAGVGNIYADEALFRARLHPLRPAGALRGAQLEALRGALIDALRAGIEARGATIDDFRDPDGVRGGYQDRFLVHRRAGLPCPACGAPVRKIVAAGRGTYVCERCQVPPRRGRSRPVAQPGSAPSRRASSPLRSAA